MKTELKKLCQVAALSLSLSMVGGQLAEASPLDQHTLDQIVGAGISSTPAGLMTTGIAADSAGALGAGFSTLSYICAEINRSHKIANSPLEKERAAYLVAVSSPSGELPRVSPLLRQAISEQRKKLESERPDNRGLSDTDVLRTIGSASAAQ